MVASCDSQRTVFRRIAQKSFVEWPAYDSTPLYDRSSLAALKEDIRAVSSTWFDHKAHDSVDEFVSHYPVTYVEFRPHDRYSGATQYEMAQLFRLFLLKELHGWTHETALLTYLTRSPELCEQLSMETVPDQSTLWRSWHERFTTELRETIETAARVILIKAQNAGVAVPREPERNFPSQGDEEESDPDNQTILNEAGSITNHISHIVFPAFSLDRGDGCEIHENAYWDLHTYLGLRERLAANEGARSFVYESTRDRTPLGHAHREHIRDLSIEQIREMYRQAVNRLLDEVAETEEFFRAGIISLS